MPNNYNGKPNNLGGPAAVSILSSTNTSPIVVRTSAPHGLVTGDVVWIYDHQVNIEANGESAVDVVDSDHFSIAGTTGAGAGGATGTVQILTFNPAGTVLPSDATDDMDAASVNVALEHLLDRTALLEVFLKANVIGAGAIVRAFNIANHQDKTLGSNGTASMNNTEVALSNSKFTIDKLNSGQVVIFFYAANVAGTGTAQIAPGFVSYAPGGTPGAYTALTWQAVDSTIRGKNFIGATIFTGFNGGNMDIALLGFSPGVGTATFYGSYTVTVFVIGG